MDIQTTRLYNDLAWIWPMWGDPETEYAVYCSFIAENLHHFAKRELESILIIGCGGGKNLYNLKTQFQATGLDLSESMLTLAQELNPECDVIQADMRNYKLRKEFDAILIDDAISYMTNREDLERVFIQAYKHLAPGGVMAVTPDFTSESFVQNRTQVSDSLHSSKYPNTQITYITNDFSADLAKEQYEVAFVYIIKENGKIRIETEVHEFGLFPYQIWRDLLIKTGFIVYKQDYRDDEAQYVSFFFKTSINLHSFSI